MAATYSLVARDPFDDNDDATSEGSMDMVNDPRFTTATVLDRRLAAFTAQVGFVGGLTSGASLGQVFKLKAHLKFGYCNVVPFWKIMQSVIQLVSFFGMSVVLCLSLYSTLVSVNQSYLGNRLMTAGANGFELAKTFYMNSEICLMRHRAVKFLARALILLLVSSGGMLYVKFSEDQDIEAGFQDDELHIASTTEQPRHEAAPVFCESHIHPAGVLVMVIFCSMSWYLYYYIQLPHERLFKEIYSLRNQQEAAFGHLLEEVRAGQTPISSSDELKPQRSRALRREEAVSVQRRPAELAESPKQNGKCIFM
eukprot:TRINITY_DN107348_c0_g1_i1.p1 TRINITY_DN107348_c0_g1~~TRINITY_DN107348_c0_g1_i1.p1  ORF type:complete len:327 (+),score=50.82 TRINITY_DN107348_c0_g1_i1:52-981(+)